MRPSRAIVLLLGVAACGGNPTSAPEVDGSLQDAAAPDVAAGDDAETGTGEAGSDGGAVTDAAERDVAPDADSGMPDGPECTPVPNSCGVPSTCPSPKLCCGGKCVDINTDPANCGCCDQACAVSHCTMGVCCVGSGEACSQNFGCCANLQMCSSDASACP